MILRDAECPPADGTSVSEIPDLRAPGMIEARLRDAAAEIANHECSSACSPAFSRDLWKHGFTEFLTELTARCQNPPDHRGAVRVTACLGQPMHIGMSTSEITDSSAEHDPVARVIVLALDGSRLPRNQRLARPSHMPDDRDQDNAMRLIRDGAYFGVQRRRTAA